MNEDIPLQVNIPLRIPMDRKTPSVGNLNYSEEGLNTSNDNASTDSDDHTRPSILTVCQDAPNTCKKVTIVYIYVGEPRNRPRHIENLIYMFNVIPFKTPVYTGFIIPSLLLGDVNANLNLEINVYDDTFSFEPPETLIYHLHRSRVCKLREFA